MTKTVFALAVSSVSLVTTSCAMMSAPVIPPPAMIQTYKAPLDVDNDESQLGAKHGMSSAQNFLGIVSWGDASTRAAAENGNITTIRSADYEFLTVFGVYSKYTTVVHGD